MAARSRKRFPINATFDEYAEAVDQWARSWLWPVMVSEAAREFGFSYSVTEAAVVHREGIAIGNEDQIVRKPG